MGNREMGNREMGNREMGNMTASEGPDSVWAGRKKIKTKNNIPKKRFIDLLRFEVVQLNSGTWIS